MPQSGLLQGVGSWGPRGARAQDVQVQARRVPPGLRRARRCHQRGQTYDARLLVAALQVPIRLRRGDAPLPTSRAHGHGLRSPSQHCLGRVWRCGRPKDRTLKSNAGQSHWLGFTAPRTIIVCWRCSSLVAHCRAGQVLRLGRQPRKVRFISIKRRREKRKMTYSSSFSWLADSLSSSQRTKMGSTVCL